MFGAWLSLCEFWIILTLLKKSAFAKLAHTKTASLDQMYSYFLKNSSHPFFPLPLIFSHSSSLSLTPQPHLCWLLSPLSISLSQTSKHDLYTHLTQITSLISGSYKNPRTWKDVGTWGRAQWAELHQVISHFNAALPLGRIHVSRTASGKRIPTLTQSADGSFGVIKPVQIPSFHLAERVFAWSQR